MQTLTARPWYREPWPWILMAGPAVVVVAGIVTLGFAIGSFDGLVAEDYYKRGLAVNQVLARAERAQALGIRGTLVIADDGTGALELTLESGHALPPSLKLTLSHPTRAGLDHTVPVIAVAQGRYVGRVDTLAPGRWQAVVEDLDREWRIRGELPRPQSRSAALAG